MPSSNTPLLNRSLLIDVTFSTPTGDYTSMRRLFAHFAPKSAPLAGSMMISGTFPKVTSSNACGNCKVPTLGVPI